MSGCYDSRNYKKVRGLPTIFVAMKVDDRLKRRVSDITSDGELPQWGNSWASSHSNRRCMGSGGRSIRRSRPRLS